MSISSIGSPSFSYTNFQQQPAHIFEAQRPEAPSNQLSKKMEELVLLHAVAGCEEAQKDDNWLLKQLLLDILFGGSDGSQSISPAEQAEMINDIISSGQPGSIAQAMGQTGQATSYNASGGMVASAPIGGAISVSA